MTRILVLALLTLVSTGIAFGKGRLGGWVTYWAKEQGMRSVQLAKGSLDDVFLFAIQLSPDGDPVLAMPAKELASTVASLRKQKATVWLTVVNDRPKVAGGVKQLKDADITHSIMANPAKRKSHIRRLLDLCKLYRVDGLDVDYENLAFEDKDLYSSFIEDLSAALKAKKFLFSVTVQPKFRENRSKGPSAVDWVALGRVVDRLQIMLYNQHNTRTAPGPVSEPIWIGKVLDYAASQCDPSKVVPVLKVSGFEWSSTSKETTFPEVEGLRKAAKGVYERESSGKAPFLVYKVNGESKTAYVEDALSIRTKIAFMQSKGFDKVVLWRLGVEDPAFWEPLEPVARLANPHHDRNN